jgi:hypothetical protein
MAYWELFQDPLDFGHYIEIRIADSWTDHMRHHERVTKNVQNMENRIRTLIKDGPQPVVSHLLQNLHPINLFSWKVHKEYEGKNLVKRQLF